MTDDVALWRRAVRVFGVIALAYLIWRILDTVIRLIVWRSHWRPGLAALRRYNKRVVNPRALKKAGRGSTTAVHHTGRTSGRAYVTPVWAERSGQSIFIQLPYGTDVDWCRNVVAARGCVLDHRGARYDAVAPVIVPAAEARPHLPPFARKMHHLIGVESYLRLDICPDRRAGSTEDAAAGSHGGNPPLPAAGTRPKPPRQES